MMRLLIEANRLSKTYVTEGVETPALKDVSISIARGEFVAIMGPSGSGKSTLLHLLGLLDTPSGGEYRFDGLPARNLSDAELAAFRNQKIGFVFQSFNLLPRESVYHNVELPLHYSAVPEHKWRERVKTAIEAVGLSHRESHEAGKLSGGERQRAAIARALVCGPAVIFADEPTGNLDSKAGALIMDTLTRLNEKEKRTIVLITHETYTAEHAGRIIRLKDGAVESDALVEKHRTAKERFVK